MVDAAPLAAPGGPHLHFVEAGSAPSLLAEVRQLGAAAAVGSLRDVHSAERLFDVLAAALGLPSYFGRNWDALDECLRDLPSRDKGRNQVLILFDAYPCWRESTLLVAQLVECWLAAAAVSAADGEGLHLVFVW